MINLSEIQVGDIMSEESRYSVTQINPNNITFTHLESGKSVSLDNKYVSELLKTADQYEKEVVVTREDTYWTAKQIEDAVKKGELKSDHTVRISDLKSKGIRSLWEDITGGQVFTVNFQKQGKSLSNKVYTEKITLAAQEASNKIMAAKTGKKSTSDVAIETIQDLLKNPILSFEVGEKRTLRGYKIQFQSRDGRYDCIDMDIKGSFQEKIRMVNILTINWLVYNGIKYEIED